VPRGCSPHTPSGEGTLFSISCSNFLLFFWRCKLREYFGGYLKEDLNMVGIYSYRRLSQYHFHTGLADIPSHIIAISSTTSFLYLEKKQGGLSATTQYAVCGEALYVS